MASELDNLDFSILGSSGLKQSFGYLLEEQRAKLRGRQAAKVYNEMRSVSPIIGGIQLAINSLIKSAEWRVEPATAPGQKRAAREWARFVDGAFHDMDHPFSALLDDALTMIPHGWAYCEVTKKLRKGDSGDERTQSEFDDGLVGWREMALRAQDTLDHWEIDESGRILGMWQMDTYGRRGGRFVFIPSEKAVHFRTDASKQNPEGRSLYSNAYRPYFFGKRIEEAEAIGIERDLQGYPIMEVPLELLGRNLPADKQSVVDSLFEMVRQIRVDQRHGALIPAELDRQGNPTGFKLRPFSTGGSKSIKPDEVIKRYDSRVAMSMIAEFQQLGVDQGGGSLALHDSKTSLFAAALGAIMDMIVEILDVEIGRLMTENQVPRELWPSLVHGDIEERKLSEVGSYLTSLAAADQLPEDSETLRRKLLEIGHLPVDAEEEDREGGTTDNDDDAGADSDVRKKRAKQKRTRKAFRLPNLLNRRGA